VNVAALGAGKGDILNIREIPSRESVEPRLIVRLRHHLALDDGMAFGAGGELRIGEVASFVRQANHLSVSD
jgi:hypothetical protein